METVDLTEDFSDDLVAIDSPSPLQSTNSTENYSSYYQRSINTILETIIEIHGNILDDDEHSLLQRLLSLDPDAQKLFYRLFLRKEGWIRARKLDYKEIKCIKSACGLLRSANLAEGGEARRTGGSDCYSRSHPAPHPLRRGQI